MMPGNRKAETTGPLINIPAVRRTKIISRSLGRHESCVRSFVHIKTPMMKMTSAKGMSVRTRVASRGVIRLKLNAANVRMAGAMPKADLLNRTRRKAIVAADSNEGRRQASSQERVTKKKPAEIQPTSGGLVAIHS